MVFPAINHWQILSIACLLGIQTQGVFFQNHIFGFDGLQMRVPRFGSWCPVGGFSGPLSRYLYVIVNLYICKKLWRSSLQHSHYRVRCDSLLLVSELMHCCKAEDCSDKGSLLVSYCLRMLSECLTQLTSNFVYWGQ